MAASPASADHGTTHSWPSVEQTRDSYGNYRIKEWETAQGQSATCGPASGGDGWSCTSHIPNLIRTKFTVRGDSTNTSSMDQVGIEVLEGGSWRYSNSNNDNCPGGLDCSTPTRDYLFLDDGTFGLEGWYIFTLAGCCGSYDDRTDTNIVGSFDAITTASDIVNEPPTVQSVTPSGSIARSTPLEHEQQFSMRATDPDGHRWTGELEITDPDGVVLPVETFAGTRTRSGSTVTSNPRTLPHKNGTYTWRARAKDTSGKSTAQGPWAYGDFTYTWNSAPTVPVQHAPYDSATAAEGQPVTFVIQADDPQLDSYAGRVEVRVKGSTTATWTADTSESASGGVSIGTVSGLPDGLYEWRAQAVDQHDWEGPWSGWQDFEVARTSNSAPGTPSQTAPASGATFADGQTQTFTITTTDPDDDDYVGVVEVRSGGVVVAEFATAKADSGQSSSGRPAAALPAGSYSWTARAVDDHGGASGTSGSLPFTVAAPANAAPSAPTQVSPAGGESWRASDPQLFTLRASDPDGDPYKGRVTVTNTSTGDTTVFETALAPSGQDSSGAPVPPLSHGSYTWSAVAIDDQGAVSAPSTSRSLTVLANRAPGIPTQVTPEHDGTFGPTDPQVFAARASDPDGDAYRAEIRVKQGTSVKTTFTTGAVPSGMDAHGVPPQPLPAGDYSWEARAIDVAGESSNWSGTRDFTVLPAPDNQPPSIGSRSPSSGHTFERDEAQVFSVTATDEENDAYTGHVTVRKASNNAVVTEFATSPAASGTPSAGSPVPALGAGDYTWTVTVTDPTGSGQSVTSSALPFSVEGNQAPGTPTLRSPSSGASFAPEDPQVFTIRSSDPDGDAYDGTVIVRDASSGAEVTRFPTAVADSGQDSSGTPAVPLSAGSYTWAAHAHDVFGATSADTAPRSFTVEEVQAPTPPPNSPPGTPTLVAPANGSSSEAGEPVVFTIRASDPDGDAYVGQVTIRDASNNVVAQFDTSPAASGSDSSGAPAEVLEPGGYSWTARATDPAGSGTYGPTSSSRSFTIASEPAPPPNDPPGAPTLVSPVEGHSFGAAEPQVFTIRATDPDGDAYLGRVTVRNAVTGLQVTTFDTAPAPSGAESSGAPVAPLGPGNYTWTAQAKDPAGSDRYGPESGPRGLEIETQFPGNCTTGNEVVDGYVAETYVRVASDVAGDTAFVCLRFDDDGPAAAGGELRVTSPEGASPPVVSTSTAVCDTPGSEPVPQPLVKGELGDPAEPETYVKYYADVRLDGDKVTVCVKSGTQGSDTNVVSRAITITVPDAGDVTPDVNFAPYTGGAPLPPEAPHDDVSQPSADCQTATSGDVTRLLNLAVDGVRTYVHAHTDTDLARACVRVTGGSQNGGGTASIDTSGFPGITPVADVLPGVGPHDADSPCSLQVVHNDTPVTVDVHRSGTGDIPAALCVQLGSTSLSVQLGFEGDPAATPDAGFTPDT